jgi:hypothetical protein
MSEFKGEVDPNILISDVSRGEDIDASTLNANVEDIAGFVMWAAEGSKHYNQKSEFEKRLENWKLSDRRIKHLNEYEQAKYGDDPNAVKFKHNFASDLDDWEFRKIQGLGKGRTDIEDHAIESLELDAEEDDLPDFLTSGGQY